MRKTFKKIDYERLSKKDYQNLYEGMQNITLFPLMHFLVCAEGRLPNVVHMEFYVYTLWGR